MENETEGVGGAPVADEAAAALEAAGEAAHGGETTGAEVLGVAETTMPQLDVGLFPNLIFWLIVSLLALYFILTRVALPRIGTILAERSDAISNDLEMAAILKRRAQQAEAAYNAALAKARDEASRIAADAKAQVGRELAALTARADAEIAAKAAESEGRIREIEASAAESVTEVAKSTALALVAALGPRPADEAAVEAAVDARLGR